MARGWYLRRDGKIKGPLSKERLITMNQQGELQPTDEVSHDRVTWKPVEQIPGLSQTGIETPVDDGEYDEHEGGSGAETAKKIWSSAGQMAKSLGSATSGFFGDDDGGSGTDSTQPAIFLESDFFGGRTRIGVPLSVLDSFAGRVAAALLSWAYLFHFLRQTGSVWEFLPFSKTEYVRINLKQRVRWHLVTPLFIVWCALMFGLSIAVIVLNVFSGAVADVLGDWFANFAGFASMVLLFGGYLLANLLACQSVLAIGGANLHRSETSLEYGFPTKYRLLTGVSDAPAETQLAGVLALCQALAESDFSPWDQFSSHGGSAAGFGALYKRLSS